MRNILAWIQKHLFRIGIFVASLALFFGLLFALLSRFLSGDTTPVDQASLPQFKNTPYTLRNVTFTGRVPVFPDALPLARNTLSQPRPEEKARALAESFSLLPHDVLENVWLSDTTAASVALQEDQSLIFFANHPDTYERLPSSFDESRAQDAAQAFLQTVGYGDLFTNAKVEWNYLTADGEARETSRAEASIFELLLTPQLQDVPLFYQVRPNAEARIWLDSNSTVTKATLPSLFLTLEAGEEKQLLSVENAVDNIRNGKYTVINVSQESGNLTILSEFSRVELRQVALEYRFIPELNSLYPYYRFSGITTSPAPGAHFQQDADIVKPQATIEVLTPAIATK